jgi:DNA helicase-2/ATP-dependent DNA helicase PcrA
VLEVANKLATSMGGYRKTLRATRPSGPAPVLTAVADDGAEVDAVVAAVRKLHDEESVPLEQIAVLYRINARSEPFEEAFAAAHIPYQVRDGAFLGRPGPRSVFQRLKRASGAVDEAVAAITDDLATTRGPARCRRGGHAPGDLGRLRALATEFTLAHPHGDVAAFVEELSGRFSVERNARGVNLLTYHRAKGLEFDAVFLPRLLDGELPFRSGRSKADPEEERRLLYVGITRARRYLFLTWPTDAKASRSPYLDELGVARQSRTKPTRGPGCRPAGAVRVRSPQRLAAKARRGRRVPAYVVFSNKTLEEIAARKPRDWADLAAVSGVGPAKLERYGDEVLAIVSSE